MLNEHSESLGSKLNPNERINLYPVELGSKIDTFNELIYTNLNNGAYKAGFSSSQNIYKTAYMNYFNTLEKLNNDR